MDFMYRYTHEQDEFRREVRDWLAENLPTDINRPLESSHVDAHTWEEVRQFRLRLGRKGWAASHLPQGIRRWRAVH